jgi:hypothetical protein
MDGVVNIFQMRMINPDGQHGGVFEIWKQLSVHDTLHF